MSGIIKYNLISNSLTLIIIFALMSGVICCTKKTSAANINHPAATVEQEPEKITLNGKDIGTIADTSVLVKKLQDVFKDREHYGAFKKNSNEIEKEIFISGNSSLSAQDFIKIYSAVKKAGAAPIKIPVESNIDQSPNPLTLFVFAGQKESSNGIFPDIPQNGIEVSFVGQMLQTDNESAFDKTEILITVDKDDKYLINGQKISQNTLETEIKNRLRNNPRNNKKIFAQIGNMTNYGMLANIASAAVNAGCSKVYFITPNATVTEQGISFSLPPTWIKDDEAKTENEIFYDGPDETRFSITLGDKLFDEDRSDEIRQEYERLSNPKYRYPEQKLLEIDGTLGIYKMDKDQDSAFVYWSGFRKKDGKFQYVSLSFGCPINEFEYRRYEFISVLHSIKFGQN